MQHSVKLDGNDYIWDGKVYKEKNKAKTVARRYLRWGFKVIIKTNNGSFFVYTHRPHWVK